MESTDAVVGDKGRGKVASRRVSACHRCSFGRIITVREIGVEPDIRPPQSKIKLFFDHLSIDQ